MLTFPKMTSSGAIKKLMNDPEARRAMSQSGRSAGRWQGRRTCRGVSAELRMKVVRIGKRLVGEGQSCFLAAEVGINHNGDMDLARRSIDAAADAGADAVKFQNYRTEDFISDRSLTHEYVSQGKTVVESQYDMFKRCELGPAQLRELSEHCNRRGVVFFSTPTSENGIQELVELGVPLLKNGSDYLVNLPLIRAMARTGLPTVISTGMATQDEVKDGVEAFRGAGGRI